MSSRVLHNQALVAFHSLQDRRLLDLPGTDIGPILLRLGVLLLGIGRSPPGCPVIGELLEERSFEGGRLEGLANAENGGVTQRSSGEGVEGKPSNIR